MNRDLPAPVLPRGPHVVPLVSLARGQLLAMLEAAEKVLECHRALDKAGLNVVGEVLRGHGTFFEFDHYPEDDVYDSGTHSQYYYHAHPGLIAEHGHFHTFMRAPGMPPGIAPARFGDAQCGPLGDAAICHLIAISMDAYGQPIGLFATNRWVTGETWYPASDVIRMLYRFRIEHAHPSWPVNIWISAVLRLFRPQIEALLRHREAVVAARRGAYPDTDVLEDRTLEVTGYLPISIGEQVGALQRALGCCAEPAVHIDARR